jgi:hypothetical protein
MLEPVGRGEDRCEQLCTVGVVDRQVAPRERARGGPGTYGFSAKMTAVTTATAPPDASAA